MEQSATMQNVVFLRPSSGYSCSICSYTYARTTLHAHTTLTTHMYKQTYNYTQIRRPRLSRDHQKPPRLCRRRARRSPFVDPHVGGRRLETIQMETVQIWGQAPVRHPSVDAGHRTRAGGLHNRSAHH